VLRISSRSFAALALTITLAATAAACGGDDAAETASGGDETTTTAAPGDDDTTTTAADDGATTTAAPNPDKPAVEIPTEMPTELVITDLTPGEGRAAEAGDTVIVDYVGVRSEDGTEFDNSYDRGEPFPVTLGSGGVIAGWDQGLIGAQTGMRRQLDIPADLAYGDSPQPGGAIQPGDALSFVIDVRAVIGPVDPADAPDVTVEPSTGATEVGITDLVVGDGPVIESDQTAVAAVIAYRGDTAEVLSSSWTDGQPAIYPLDVNQVIPGLVDGTTGMNVGGRRQIVIPPADGFGEAGNEQLGIPAGVDLILVIDLISVY
jgi:FKBP-type peptidyl-prolyl cis-trans isomerase